MALAKKMTAKLFQVWNEYLLGDLVCAVQLDGRTAAHVLAQHQQLAMTGCLVVQVALLEGPLPPSQAQQASVSLLLACRLGRLLALSPDELS